MPDEKRYTERDLIRAKRRAFERGGEAVFRHFGFHVHDSSWRGTSRLAAEAYPLPTITRPRVVTDPVSTNGRVWRCLNGQLETLIPFAPVTEAREWHRVEWSEVCALFVEHSPPPTPARVALWADLLANPTEEVDDDA